MLHRPMSTRSTVDSRLPVQSEGSWEHGYSKVDVASVTQCHPKVKDLDQFPATDQLGHVATDFTAFKI